MAIDLIMFNFIELGISIFKFIELKRPFYVCQLFENFQNIKPSLRLKFILFIILYNFSSSLSQCAALTAFYLC
jgi:hypothetical protein